MKHWIDYFIQRPLVANVIMFGLILASIVLWRQIGKEEMPEFAMNWVRVSIPYPGASAEDVELFVAKPIEEKLKGVTGLREVANTSAYGSSSFRITFEPRIQNLQEKIQEVKDAVDSVELPREVEDPVYRQFRSAEKAIIDVGIYLKNVESLDVPNRIELQKYALAFKNRILGLPEISGVESNGYLRPELQIKVKPKSLERYELSMSQVRDMIIQQNVRRPIGNMKDKGESEVTIDSELSDVEAIEKVIVSSGFQGQRIRLSEVAVVEQGFEESNTITKVQGHEGIIFNIQKSSTVDILSGQKAVVQFIENFKRLNPEAPVDFVLIDDESYDVRNRLALIGSNGLVGFLLIVAILFLFLDFKAGIWVAMGIPFSLAFTLIAALVMGYTVNNMTLAAIIIVLGIVVDDAIIVAENITRKVKADSAAGSSAATMEVFSPVLASVLTTCAAFLPLYFFTGRFGLFVKVIPTIVFLMLLASLIESYFILPSHMSRPLKILGVFKGLRKYSGQARSDSLASFAQKRAQVTEMLEKRYQALLLRLLYRRGWVMMAFLFLLASAAFLYQSKLKYVMFPREESRDLRVQVTGPEGTPKDDMSKLVRKVEDIFLNDQRGFVTAVYTSIGQNRRGGEVRENEASVVVEIVPPSERNVPFNKLLEQWESQSQQLEGFDEIRFLRSRFGSDSGSPIAIEIQENDDSSRQLLVDRLKKEMEQVKDLINVEVEKPVSKNEFRLFIKREDTSRLGISDDQLSLTLRAYIEGDILHTLNTGEEEVDVRLTAEDATKDDIQRLLSLTVPNKDNYLVPISGLVKVERGRKSANIQRTNYKRVTSIFADIQEGSSTTPLEVAEQLEQEAFPKVLAGSPSAHLQFRGEIEDSRESREDFILSVILVLAIIYVLLVFLFDSLWTPFLIGAIIPFGMVGTAIAFWLHGMSQYGFFAVVGTLGMIGVVINDSIVMIDKLLATQISSRDRVQAFDLISQVCSTRLRAVVVTTLTTVAGLFPTAYGIAGYDSMLAEMMLAMGWGLLFGMFITLVLVPCLYSYSIQLRFFSKEVSQA